MGPRKIKKKEKVRRNGGLESEDTSNPVPGTIESIAGISSASQLQHYVTLDMRLLNWNYLNFKLRLRTSTRLFVLKDEIRSRHGQITDLKICRGYFAEKNELRDDMSTLQDYGIEGVPENEPEAVCVIQYDFKPKEYDNPILLAST
uniref:Uncharacterized protein AlNc14C187G8347 n=1 Tax=Albugo laibachii Nc14 TaxID=890382 RepID=F0WPK2_9STRA|nr:expressed unknown protein putative [Albugo laibachii Nc14]|eukprot:CCA23252.1 expressed unknown protein putative [Albugo laibachii Nc14]